MLLILPANFSVSLFPVFQNTTIQTSANGQLPASASSNIQLKCNYCRGTFSIKPEILEWEVVWSPMPGVWLLPGYNRIFMQVLFLMGLFGIFLLIRFRIKYTSFAVRRVVRTTRNSIVLWPSASIVRRRRRSMRLSSFQGSKGLFAVKVSFQA